MYVQKSLKSVHYDVDDTLILWNSNKSFNKSDLQSIDIMDPYLGPDATPIRVRPNQSAINHLKQKHKEGNTIVVWSAGGWAWAEAVVKALNLEPYISLVMSKPDEYVDDLESKEFLGIWVRVNVDRSLTEVDHLRETEKHLNI